MSFIHPLADVQSEHIGANTKIWQFCVVLKGANIGDNCNICSHCFIENNVVIGNNVTLKFYVELCDGVILEDDVFIAPNVSFTNDPNPRSKKFLYHPSKTLIKKGASIAAGVSLIPGITIGSYAFIGLGSVVTKNIPDFTLWVGNPARQTGYVTKDAVFLNMHLKCKKTGIQYQLSKNGEPILA